MNLTLKTADGEKIPLEIELMYKVKKCKNCIKIIDYKEENDDFLIVMERPKHCVDMWDHIYEHGPFNETKAKKYFMQILEGVLDLKSNNVIHRDIKDENILVDSVNDEIKIIDFGGSAFYKNEEDLYDFHGIYSIY